PNWQPLQQVLAGANPAAPPPLTPAGPVAPSPYSRPITDGLAVASLVLGVLGLVVIPFICSLPAVICGHLSLGRIRRAAGALAGHGMAVAGLLTGYFGIVIWGLILAIVFAVLGAALGDGRPFKHGIFKEVSEVRYLVEAGTRAATLFGACQDYASDHDGRFPDDLQALVPKYLTERSALRVRLQRDQPEAGFDYYGGTTSDPPKKILFASQARTSKGERLVGRIDGRVEVEAAAGQAEPPVESSEPKLESDKPAR
ncbi:MAG: DUF4190 domain-containing protein, partial [Verrucomicrobiota bacterium]|nr:DUF4190 domain-containing protein [Verrucomicrobiota bacterium]